MCNPNVAIAGVFAVLSAFAHADERVFDVAAGHHPTERITWKVGGTLDLSSADGVEFDFLCDNLGRFYNFYIQFCTKQSASRDPVGYSVQFQPLECGRWGHVRLRKTDVATRFKPYGSWSGIESVELVGEQGEGAGAARVGIRNMRAIVPENLDAVVVLGEDGGGDGGGQVRRCQEALDILGVNSVVMSDTDLVANGVPRGVKLVCCPKNPKVPDGMCGVLTNFVARGGRIFWAQGVPDEVKTVVDANPESFASVGVSLNRDGNKHVFAFANRLRPVLEKLVPEYGDRIERAAAARVEKEKKMASEVMAMPSAYGEERVLYCQYPYGPWPDGGGLSRAAKFAKECGFTALDVKVCVGSTAWYRSNVLRQAKEVAVDGDVVERLVEACRENGVKSVAWRCCFHVGSQLPSETIAEYERAGRLSVRRDMLCEKSFLCPVCPINRKEDVDAFAELARRGVDALDMDFIRYSWRDNCCCRACREAFEAKLGKRVENWPEDVFKNESDGGLQKRWSEFRVEVIKSHIREIRDAVKAVNPKVELWGTCFPNATSAYRDVAQDWPAWCRENLIDRLGMMDYTSTTAGLEGLIAVQRQNDFGSFANYAPIFGDVRWQGAATIAEKALVAARQIEAIRRQGYRSFAFFGLRPDTAPVLKLLGQGPLKEN